MRTVLFLLIQQTPSRTLVCTYMENYLLCGELGSTAGVPPNRRASEPSSNSGSSSELSDGGCLLYKGRRKGSVEFVGIWKHSKTKKDLIANGVCIMHSLDHENVLKFLEWYETPKHIWVITELATGGSLADILEQDGCIPPPHLNDFISDVAKGLHYLHSRNIIYCDLQPKKILLDNCQLLKLSDFTLAQNMEDCNRPVQYDLKRAAQVAFGELQSGGTEATAVDTIPSPFYAAPELFEGGRFDTASDLWSLGVLTYELCTGRQPFHGSSSDELVFTVCRGRPDMELITSAASTSDASKVTDMITLLLQRSPKARSWKDFLQKHLFV